MQDMYRWWDALEEVLGAIEERASSPWDVLNLVALRPTEDRLSVSPGDVDLSVTLGPGKDAPSIGLPLVLAEGSRGQLSPQSRLALLQSAARTGAALRLSDPEPDLVELGQELGVAMWAVVGPRRTAQVVEAMRGAMVVELQVAAMGPDGGLVRSVDAWDPEGSLARAVAAVRQVSDGSPVVLNTGPLSDRDMLRRAVLSGADAVMVQGLSRSSLMHRRMVGTDPLAAVASMVRTVARTKRPEGSPAPKLVVSGGFKDGVEVAKAIALGADLVLMGTAPRIALGCSLCGLCGPGDCPRFEGGEGAKGQGPAWKAQAEDLIAYLGRVAGQLRTALAQMGCSRVTEASPANLEAYTYDAAAVTGAPLAGYGETLPMWLH